MPNWSGSNSREFQGSEKCPPYSSCTFCPATGQYPLNMSGPQGHTGHSRARIMPMKTRLLLGLATFLVVNGVQAQSQLVDCSCMRTQAVLMTNACIGFIPDMCQFTNCFINTLQPPPVFSCSQSPAAGGAVGPGTYPITITVAANGQVQQCAVLFTVNPPQTGPFAMICAPNKTVECGTTWSFDTPTPTNYCCPNATVPGNGVTITVVSTTTNGACPEVITQTWKGVDDCGHTATCSQTVTVVDTTPPTLDCNCLRNPAVFPTTVTACQAAIPDFCLLMSACANEACGPLTCTQSPAANTVVGPGTQSVTVTVTDCAGNSATCVVVFTVISPQNGPFGLVCAPNKTVECGTTWSFDPPAYTNACCPASGTPPNATITVASTTTNGTCPMVITRTWQGVDDCGATATCSQTVTVVDTTPPTLDCNCLRNSAATPPLTVTGCNATIPNLCALASTCGSDRCGPLTCSQSPAAGTPVGPGTHPITVTLTDCAGNTASCTVVFTVNGPQTGPFALICAPNKTVECGTTWTFDPPVYTNACCPPAGTTGNVTVNVVNTTTNGLCPEIITRTWQARDSCGNTATCSQTVTVVDTTAPLLDCHCLQDPASVQLTVTACSNAIPNLCLLAANCATDNCGPLNCSQTPAAGTIVTPGTYPITVTVTDCASNAATCTVLFTVVAPADGCNPCNIFTNIWNTGMGGTLGNVALATGSPDPNYTLVSMPSGACTGPAQVLPPGLLPSAWVPNGPNSQWIGAGPAVNCQSGVYQYRVAFFVSCPDSASIAGQWTADDWAEIRLNGVPTGHSVPSTQFPNVSFAGWHPVLITNGFVCGTNYLDLFVTNASFSFDNPTGLRAQLTNLFNDCCCTESQNPSVVLSGANNNGLLPAGALDTQFSITCAPPGVTATTPVVINPGSIPGGWLPNGPNSQWIGADPNAAGLQGVYCYTLSFNIPCPPNVPIKGSITGRWAADNTGAIHLNGQPTGNTLPDLLGFVNWQAFNVTNGFLAGVNTLTFYVTNHNGPTGLRLELTNSVACCDCNPCRMTCPTDMIVTTCQPQEVVFYTIPTLSGGCDPNATITCSPPSGSSFPANTSTLVTCTASDSSGNVIDTCTFAVTVMGDTRPPTCPPSLSVTGCPPRMPDFSTNSFITDDCTPPGQITVTQNILPGTPLPPNTSTIVIVTVCDQAGNCRTCDVGVTAYSSAKPPKINCPKDITVLTCSNSATVTYKATASGPPSAITCTPPSGSVFPLGTNFVTCCVTNVCGDIACCEFKVIVKPALVVNPTVFITGGVADNFAGGVEASPPNSCMISAFSGYTFWKGFDAPLDGWLMGHRFTGLPNNILQAELIVHMKPGTDSGSDNDGLFIGLGSSCTFASFMYGQSIKLLPGASPPTGGTWIQPSNGPTTFTLNLGTLNPGFINKLNTDQFLDVVVHDDTTVDYMRLRLWVCPPKHPGIGIPFDIINGATVAQRVGAVVDDDTQIAKPLPPGLCIFPNPNGTSGILMHPGTPKALTFTTHLDFDAPGGATFGLALPGEPGAPPFAPLLTFRKCEVPGCGYDLKINKRMFVADSGNLRSTGIQTNGDFSSFSHLGSEPDLENFARFVSQPGVTSMWVTVTLDCDTREMTLQIPDCIWTPDNGRKGWDGCIYGNGTPSKGLKGSGRLILSPTLPLEPRIRIGSVPLALLAKGFTEVGIEDPTVTSQERKWGDGHVTLMKAYDDEESARKIEWVSLGAESGVNVDLGRSASFDIGIHHFETGDIPNEEQVVRVMYPPGPLTNRPPRDTLTIQHRGAYLNFTCSFDEGRYVSVQLWRDGVKVKEQTHIDTQGGEPLGRLGRWIEHLGRPHSGGLYLRSSTSFAVLLAGEPEPTDCDDLRIIPEREPGTVEHPYITGLEIQTSDGMESLAYELSTTSACPAVPARMNIAMTTSGTLIEWFDDCYVLQGADDVTGPWYDLRDPVDPTPDGRYQATLPSNQARKFYRLEQRD